jgi:hypothetical protein
MTRLRRWRSVLPIRLSEWVTFGVLLSARAHSSAAIKSFRSSEKGLLMKEEWRYTSRS